MRAAPGSGLPPPRSVCRTGCNPPGGCTASQRARRGGRHGGETLSSVPHPEERTRTAQTGRYPGKYDLGPHCSVVNPNGLCLHAAAHGARTPRAERNHGAAAWGCGAPRTSACTRTHNTHTRVYAHTHPAAVRPPPDFTPQQAEPRVQGGGGGEGGGSRLGRFAQQPGARHGTARHGPPSTAQHGTALSTARIGTAPPCAARSTTPAL